VCFKVLTEQLTGHLKLATCPVPFNFLDLILNPNNIRWKVKIVHITASFRLVYSKTNTNYLPQVTLILIPITELSHSRYNAMWPGSRVLDSGGGRWRKQTDRQAGVKKQTARFIRFNCKQTHTASFKNSSIDIWSYTSAWPSHERISAAVTATFLIQSGNISLAPPWPSRCRSSF
jgi:hypothetical protein